MENTTTEKAPVLFIELVDMKDSGFVQDGTENTPHENRLRAPSVKFIPNVGYRKAIKKQMLRGELQNVTYNEKIRFIRNEIEISVEAQKAMGIEPSSRASEDKITMNGGYMTVTREGAFIGLYDYLKDVFYNESNPDRSDKATAIYRVVIKDEGVEESNFVQMMEIDAMNWIKDNLVQKIGKNQVTYNEDKIDGVCQLFNIYAETPAGKIQALMTFAKMHAEQFLNRVEKWQNTVETEVTHALSLDVITFKENIAMYKDGDKVIKSLGTQKLNKHEKISLLADFLRTSDGREQYDIFKARLEEAKDKK